MADTWQTKVARRQQLGRDLIPKQWRLPTSITDQFQEPMESRPYRLLAMDLVKQSGLLTDREHDITENYTTTKLLQSLATGKFSSLEVTTAYCKRAAIAQQLVSCLTETYFEEALVRAKSLDEDRAAGKSLGPLFGLPVSIKDCFRIVGGEATAGYVSLLGEKATQNSVLVDLLLELGAVLYVKTNIPQTMMTADSHNHIFGRTLNPHNTAHTAGGSSGGEGALIAFRGSPLGVGTDVAGSIRIPALCCGTYGFKPSPNRIPFAGQTGITTPGFRPIMATAGPLANDFDTLTLFTKSVIDLSPARFDSTALDVPWRTLSSDVKPKLRLGVLAADPLYPLHPPVKRALDEAVNLLEGQGHEILRLTAAECHVSDAVEVAYELFILMPEATHGFFEASGEPPVPSVTTTKGPANLGNYTYLPDLSELDRLGKFAAISVKRAELAEDWRRIWETNRLDAVISPGAQNTATLHDTYGWAPYTVLMNVLEYPACVIPFSKASKGLDNQPMKMTSEQGGPDYDPETFDGMPCSIQVFTRRLQDEECLEYGSVIDQCLKRKP